MDNTYRVKNVEKTQNLTSRKIQTNICKCAGSLGFDWDNWRCPLHYLFSLRF